MSGVRKKKPASVRKVRKRVDVGSKYHRRIFGLSQYHPNSESVVVDVYSVMSAYEGEIPFHSGIHHAIKKLLCSGIRGHKGYLTDLEEAIASIRRAIDAYQTGEHGSKHRGRRR